MREDLGKQILRLEAEVPKLTDDVRDRRKTERELKDAEAAVEEAKNDKRASIEAAPPVSKP